MEKFGNHCSSLPKVCDLTQTLFPVIRAQLVLNHDIFWLHCGGQSSSTPATTSTQALWCSPPYDACLEMLNETSRGIPQMMSMCEVEQLQRLVLKRGDKEIRIRSTLFLELCSGSCTPNKWNEFTVMYMFKLVSMLGCSASQLSHGLANKNKLSLSLCRWRWNEVKINPPCISPSVISKMKNNFKTGSCWCCGTVLMKFRLLCTEWSLACFAAGTVCVRSALF